MNKRFQFHTEDERLQLLEENKGMAIIEEEYIIDGNFITFSDIPAEPLVVYINVPQKDFKSLQDTVDSILTDIIPGLMP